jgi:hypothetical protein
MADLREGKRCSFLRSDPAFAEAHECWRVFENDITAWSQKVVKAQEGSSPSGRNAPATMAQVKPIHAIARRGQLELARLLHEQHAVGRPRS